MGLSKDPAKRQRQLDALDAGRHKLAEKIAGQGTSKGGSPSRRAVDRVDYGRGAAKTARSTSGSKRKRPARQPPPPPAEPPPPEHTSEKMPGFVDGILGGLGFRRG